VTGAWRGGRRAAVLGLLGLLAIAVWAVRLARSTRPDWRSANRYRILLEVDTRGVPRSHSPASVEIDFGAELRAGGDPGRFDESTIEVVALDASSRPRVFDHTRSGTERYLLPWHLEKLYPLDTGALSFVLPDQKSTRYAVFFDTVESKRGRPLRYAGLVGDGDLFSEGYGRREIAASGYDTFADLDRDGDLDLVQGGTAPFLRVFENRGGNRFGDRGGLSSAGALLVFPHDDANRGWLAPAFVDWDGDGDLDLFVSFLAAPHRNQVLRYENVTAPGGQPAFAERGLLVTASGKPVAGTLTFVDWDGDSRVDVLAEADSLIAFHRNVGSNLGLGVLSLADGTDLEANGVPIQFKNPRTDVADVDSDGDLDLMAGTDEGRVYLFENVGTRTQPVLAMGRMLVYHGYLDARASAKVADWDGDGLLDFVVGRYWQRSHWGDQPRVFGRLYENAGTRTAPRFEARDAYHGAPYTEGFQPCDAVRQNGVRAADWDGDGQTDLIAGDSDGFVWFFRSLANGPFSFFETPLRLQVDGRPLKVYGEEMEGRIAGYARPEVADWNDDGRLDLLVADGRAWLTLFLNLGRPGRPALSSGQRVAARGRPIDGTARGSVLVADWDNDGKKDVIFSMVGEGGSPQHDWPDRNPDPGADRGFLFYKNVGTDAAPTLAYPKWIKAGPNGGEEIDFSRPNLGAFVDWDGDGKKDFIACEFEMNCRLYRNTGSGEPGARPVFGSSVEGEMLVKPWVGETISGAEAIDWNGDGDVDILTGQGHGGSGIRFFEHDYLRDRMQGTEPRVRILRVDGAR
jgi:hypothetical protein